MSVTITTTGHVTIRKRSGKHAFAIIFEGADQSIQKTYKVKGAYGLITDGAVIKSGAKATSKLKIISMEELRKRHPRVWKAASKGKRSECEFHDSGGMKFCFPSCKSFQYKCILESGNNCVCKPKASLKDILPSK